METLVAVSQHRNHYYSRSKSQFSDGFSSPSSGFREISCRTFQSEGILQSPFGFSSYDSPPTTKSATSFSNASESLIFSSFENDKQSKSSRKSSAIPIRSNPSIEDMPFLGDLSYSELWAGPAYSNSPPPSSLPIPKFSLRQKRSVSLEIPPTLTDLKPHPLAKSAPPSPRRESHSAAKEFFVSTASATETLRRILHLDNCDD